MCSLKIPEILHGCQQFFFLVLSCLFLIIHHHFLFSLFSDLQNNPNAPQYRDELGLVGVIGDQGDERLRVSLSMSADERTPRGFDPKQFFDFVMEGGRIFIQMRRGIDRDVSKDMFIIFLI